MTKILQLLRRGRARRAARRPPGRPRRPGRLSAAAARRRPAAAGRWWRRSSRTANGCPPPGRSRAPPDTTRCGMSTALFTDPAGAGELLGLYRSSPAPPRPRRRVGRDGTARRLPGASSHDLAAETRPAHPRRAARLRRRTPHCAITRPGRCAPPCASCWSASRCTGRTSSTDRADGAGDALRTAAARDAKQGVRGARGGGGGRRGARSGLGRSGDGPQPVGLPGPVRADRLRAARQVGRGHRVLPVRAAAVGGRGRRRPGRARGAARRSSTPSAPVCSATGRPTGTVAVHARHQAQRGRTGRIAVLTECPERWAGLLAGGDRADGPRRRGRRTGSAVAWAAWQTSFGLGPAGPPPAARMRQALLKQVREAGLRTSWTEPDEAYEQAVADFAAAGPCGAGTPPGGPVRRGPGTPRARQRRWARALVQLTMPGVPDLYQGTEGDHRALVDPDNRRPRRLRRGRARTGRKHRAPWRRR